MKEPTLPPADQIKPPPPPAAPAQGEQAGDRAVRSLVGQAVEHLEAGFNDRHVLLGLLRPVLAAPAQGEQEPYKLPNGCLLYPGGAIRVPAAQIWLIPNAERERLGLYLGDDYSPGSEVVCRPAQGEQERDEGESGWLVELGSDPPRWWDGRGSFTHNAFDAIRFSRAVDAQRAIAWLVEKGVNSGCKAVQHGFWPSSVAAPSPEWIEQKVREVEALQPSDEREVAAGAWEDEDGELYREGFDAGRDAALAVLREKGGAA